MRGVGAGGLEADDGGFVGVGGELRGDLGSAEGIGEVEEDDAAGAAGEEFLNLMGIGVIAKCPEGLKLAVFFEGSGECLRDLPVRGDDRDQEGVRMHRRMDLIARVWGEFECAAKFSRVQAAPVAELPEGVDDAAAETRLALP